MTADEISVAIAVIMAVVVPAVFMLLHYPNSYDEFLPKSKKDDAP